MGALSLLSAPCGLGSDSLSDITFPVQAIERLQPALKGVKAHRLARTFEKVAARCGMDWHLLMAIAYNESSLIQGKVNSSTHDYGMMQINQKNILRYGLSRDKILRDPEYSLEFACKLLKDNRARYSAKYTYWVGIYRSGTALHRSAIRNNARSYDHMIRSTARGIGYQEFEYARLK